MPIQRWTDRDCQYLEAKSQNGGLIYVDPNGYRACLDDDDMHDGMSNTGATKSLLDKSTLENELNTPDWVDAGHQFANQRVNDKFETKSQRGRLCTII